MGGSQSAENRVLLHPECHDRVHHQRLPVVRDVSEALGETGPGAGPSERLSYCCHAISTLAPLSHEQREDVGEADIRAAQRVGG